MYIYQIYNAIVQCTCTCTLKCIIISIIIFMVINFLAIIIAEMNVSKITEPNNIISICSVLYMY